jgi:hypothetical protein
MYIKGLEIDGSAIKYVKFHKSTENTQVEDPEHRALDVYAMNTSDLGAIKNYEIEDLPEYLKLIKYDSTLFLPNFSIKKSIFEDVEINIIVALIEDENIQVDGHDEDIHNVYYFYYDRLTILLRSDKNKLSDLQELIGEGIPGLEFNFHGNPDSLVGSIWGIVMRSRGDINLEYRDTDGIDFNGEVSVLDWSHAMAGLNDLVYNQLKPYQFTEPLTKYPQEITDNKNLLKYEFSEIQQGQVRGHLVGSHWKYFYIHKMPFEYELLITETATYVRVLQLMQEFNLITNIGDYWVTANDGKRWKCAVEWKFPIENNFDLNDPKGSSDTTGNIIRISGDLHFYTIAKNKRMAQILEILVDVNTEQDVIKSNIN